MWKFLIRTGHQTREEAGPSGQGPVLHRCILECSKAARRVLHRHKPVPTQSCSEQNCENCFGSKYLANCDVYIYV